MKPNKKSAAGFTLVEFMITVVVLVVLAAMLLPAGPRPGKGSAFRLHCVNNLRQVGLAYRQWAIDHGEKYPMEVSVTNGGAMEAVVSGDVTSVFRVVSNELNTPKVLFCPADKRRIGAGAFLLNGLNNSNVTYFVGLDANQSTPEMFLAGDDNLKLGTGNVNAISFSGTPVRAGLLLLDTNALIAWSDERHGKQGNVGLSDGSVQKWSNTKLAEGLRNTGAVTNRFMFP